MSQKKVDEYKNYKKNRKKILKKEKARERAWTVAVIAVAAAFVVWFCISIYGNIQRMNESKESEAVTYEWNLSGYEEYVSGLTTGYS